VVKIEYIVQKMSRKKDSEFPYLLQFPFKVRTNLLANAKPFLLLWLYACAAWLWLVRAVVELTPNLLFMHYKDRCVGRELRMVREI
jgi:hypothetical protein